MLFNGIACRKTLEKKTDTRYYAKLLPNHDRNLPSLVQKCA